MRIILCNFTEEKNISRGVGYIAASIKAVGHELHYYEISPFEDFEKWIKDNLVTYDVLLISSNSIQIHFVHRFISICRNYNPSIPIVVGGVHATIVGPKILKQYPEIDYACIGEGEKMIVDFLHEIKSGDLARVKNLAYRENGRVLFNGISKAENLSRLPKFPWNIFPKDSVVQSNSHFTYVHATRGCPYNCSYCCNSIYTKLYGKDYLRKRPVEMVIDELFCLKQKYSPRLFYFGDESILCDVDYATSLFQEINAKVNVSYGIMGRAQQLTENIIYMLKRTGCRYIAIGVECGDETFRKQYLNRHETNDNIAKAFDLLRKYKIYSVVFNMIGYPFFFDEQLTEQTMDFLKRIRPNYTMISIFYPFLETKLGEYCIQNKLIDKKKACETHHYYLDSILHGYSLKAKRDAILRIVNKEKFGHGIYE